MNESCCSTPAAGVAPHDCPRCGTRGTSVERLTVAALTKGIVPRNQRYWLCRQLECETVYFGEDETVVTATNMNTAPGFKSKSPQALVCYCFQYRRRDIEAELVADREAVIPEHITAEVRAGNCACEVRNPSGKCCLGEVQVAMEEIRTGLGTMQRVSRGGAP